MALTSFAFLAFFLGVLILYYAVPKRIQWILLLVASYAFYLIVGVGQVFFLLGTTLVTYVSGLLMQRRRNRYKDEISSATGIDKEEKQLLKKKAAADIHRIQAITVIFDLLVLAIVKYSNFAIDNINRVIKAAGFGASIPGLNILVPLGISFYTFMAIGYTIDIGRGKYDAERNFGKLALFLSFFPSVVQGPISRYDDVGQGLVKPHKLEYENLTYGAQLIMWGFFKKLVIADRISPFVSDVFSPELVNKLSGTTVFMGMIAYAVQIYCDFSGGIDITRGVARMLGVELPLNFDRPYFSKTVAEYWRRWHMTLGAWMKDYVFYAIMLSKPISRLSKKVKEKHGQKASKYVPSIITSFIVFLLMGIWHGASWQYVAYALYNAVLISGSVALEPVFKWMTAKTHLKVESKPWKLIQMIRTFLLQAIAKLLVITPGLRVAIRLLGRMVTNFRYDFWKEITKKKISIGYKNWIVLGVAILLLFTISVLQENGIRIRSSVARLNIVIRWTLYFLLLIAIMVFGIYGPAYDAASFIYQAY